MRGQVHGGRWDGMPVGEVIDLATVQFMLIVDKDGMTDIQSGRPPAEVAEKLRQVADMLEASLHPPATEGMQ